MDAYEAYFGFSEAPFSVTPDPRFFYANAGYREAYATLRYGVEARKGFVVVTGEAGTGKTTLLRMLMQNAGSSIGTAFIFNPPHDFCELLRMILNELEIPAASDDRVGMLARFNEYLLEQLRSRRIVALLIDEAQALSHFILEELRLLSNLETNREKLVQIVLMGQPELEDKLDRPELRQLKQRVALRCRLEPLDAADVSAYVAFRLQTAGYEGEPLFDAAGIEKITAHSQGIPRLINIICENVLLRAFKSSKHRVALEMIEEAVEELRLGRPERLANGSVAGAQSLLATSPEDVAACPAAGRAGMTSALTYDFDVAERAEPPRHLESRRRTISALLPVGVWLAAFLMAATGLALHTRYNRSTVVPPADLTAEAPAGARFQRSGDGKSVLKGSAEDTLKFSAVQLPVASRTGDAEAEAGSGSTERRDNNAPLTPSPLQKPSAKAPASLEQASRSENQPGSPQARGSGLEPPRSRTGSSVRVRIYDVTGASYVRQMPRSDAEIIDTLAPGTRIQVVGKAGEYFRVRALDGASAVGYVHEEDAFFEPSR